MNLIKWPISSDLNRIDQELKIMSIRIIDFLNLIKSALSYERGAIVIEYSLIIAGIAIALIAVVGTIGVTDSSFQAHGG
jgi:Flp pilus assembly pilin Flp